MRCPYCQHDNDRVVDSRVREEGFAIRRRRECLDCNQRYTTYERLENISFKVIKQNGIREPFDPEKIRHGLTLACWKRPISDDQIETIVSAVEQYVYSRHDNEVPSREIGELVMEKLSQVDQVAYVRFASVYRRFKDVHDFVDELTPMLQNRKNSP